MTDPSLLETLVKGALELERTDRGLLPHRLPAWARAQCADSLAHWPRSSNASVATRARQVTGAEASPSTIGEPKVVARDHGHGAAGTLIDAGQADVELGRRDQGCWSALNASSISSSSLRSPPLSAQASKPDVKAAM